MKRGPADDQDGRDERVRQGRTWLLRCRGIVWVHVFERDEQMIQAVLLTLAISASWFVSDWHGVRSELAEEMRERAEMRECGN